jgi:hypothetical protein
VRRSLLVVLAAMLSGSSTDRPPSDAPEPGHYSAPIRYDGRFTLVRLRWAADSSPEHRSVQDAWSHDYPRAEQNLSAIIRELTYLDVHDDGNEILTLDDPDLFKYPLALMWEPGFWILNDREAESFRAYLLKGGFAIFEDFDGAAEWANFETQIRRVLPQGQLRRLDNADQIFNVFFSIKDIDAIVHPMSHIRPGYYGIFEGNDPSRRLMVVANYDNDVPAYWERSGQGHFPIDASNEAYKLGVNYMIYGLNR